MRNLWISAALGAMALASASAFAWWDSAWPLRKSITVEAGADAATLVGAPLLLRLHAGNFPQLLLLKDGGADLRAVADDDHTPLPLTVESFDAVNQMALVWTRLPAADSDGRTHLRLYFGNSAALPSAPAASQADVHFAFADRDHLLADDSGHGVDGSGMAVANPSSLIGGGASLTPSSGFAIADTSDDTAPGWTASLWLRATDAAHLSGVILTRKTTTAALSLTLDAGALTLRHGDSTIAASQLLSPGQWVHVAVVLSATQMQLYVDGKVVGSVDSPALRWSGPLAIGVDSGAPNGLPMDIDELEIAHSARASAYLAFVAREQGETHASVVRYGADENVASPAASAAGKADNPFGNIVQQVFARRDAQVEQFIIGLCGMLAAIAMLVTVIKTITLSRHQRASRRFLADYRRLLHEHRPFDALRDHYALYGDSPLFTLYRCGLDELQARRVADHADLQLPANALFAIKSSLDAQLALERQQLASLLVLLTIAISGGPFIGLLGTVVGVMVTFGAIAAAGDVNIAAIAPGMASALLATVAGLAVAIPALFAYNVLGAKVRKLNTDMRVFNEQLMARMSELYGA